VVCKYILEAEPQLLSEYCARIAVISVLIMASPRFCPSNRGNHENISWRYQELQLIERRSGVFMITSCGSSSKF
jgi:hypothetical protein